MIVKKKKILIIGSSKSIYIKQYIRKILDKNEFDIFLTYQNNLTKDEIQYYNDLGVKLVNIYEKRGILGKIPKLSTILFYKKNLKNLIKNGKFDFIHIHSVSNVRLLSASSKFLKSITNNLIVNFWGSDILDIDNKRVNNLRPILNYADQIILLTNTMTEKFREYFYDLYDHKIVNVLFGNTIIEEGKKNGITSDYFKFPQDKIIISIGYNGSIRQRHIEILEQLAKLDENIKKKLYIVIQVSYGISELEYIDDIESKMNELSFEGTLIREFLSFELTIELKSKVDIFIHGQETDSMSASVLEYLYFDTILLNGSWIDYREWKNLGIQYIDFSDYNEIPVKLNDIIDKMNREEMYLDEMKKNNKIIIESNFTWEARKKYWKDLY